MTSEMITIFVEGDPIEIEVEELSSFEKMKWAARAPDVLTDSDTSVAAKPEMLEFLMKLTIEQTILTKDLIEDMPPDEMGRLFNGVTHISFGKDYDAPVRSKDGTTIGSDVFEDLDDWR